MIKLITPPGILLTVALLIIYSVYAFRIGSIEKSWILLAGSAISAAASYGTAVLRPWSRYLVYFLAVGFVTKLGQSIHAGVVSGYFDFQFGSLRAALKALTPSALMALLSCVCCVLVFRHFRGHAMRNPVSPNPADATRPDTDASSKRTDTLLPTRDDEVDR